MCELHANAKLKRDPTRTTKLRSRYEAELVRRFKVVRAAIIREVATKDGFGLKTNKGRFEFDNDRRKINGFMSWLESLTAQQVLGVQVGTPVASAAERAWTNTYISSAYTSGMTRSASQLRKGGVKVSDTWVSAAFNRPIHADRVGILYTRNFRNLRDITEKMDTQISQVLAQGIAQGDNPITIARALTDRVDKIGITRARTLARTEIINAHAEATLNGFQEAGIEGVEVEAEWATAGDDLVCPICEALEGRVYKMDEARGMIPAHPNCRCAWLPLVKNGTGIELK